jgi:hypothetical protein
LGIRFSLLKSSHTGCTHCITVQFFQIGFWKLPSVVEFLMSLTKRRKHQQLYTHLDIEVSGYNNLPKSIIKSLGFPACSLGGPRYSCFPNRSSCPQHSMQHPPF